MTQFSAWQATVQDDSGNAVVNPTITVRNASDASLADIFADSQGVTALANPFIGEVTGFAKFYAPTGRYTVEGASGGAMTEEWDVVLDGDEIYNVYWATDVTALKLDTDLTYTANKPGSVDINTVVKTMIEGYNYTVADVASNDHHFTTDGGVKLYVTEAQNGRAFIEAFGAVFDSATDSTAAVQAAFASGLRLADRGGSGYLIVTDTILCEYGVDYEGASGAVLNTAAKSEWRFNPASKRSLFEWRVPPVGFAYVFEGAKIKGFSIQGGGLFGDAVFDLRGIYQGELSVDVYTGFDMYSRNDFLLGTKLGGSITDPGVCGMEWINTSAVASGVSTTCDVTTYIAQGSVMAHKMDAAALIGVKIGGIIESMASVIEDQGGNTYSYYAYSENTPKTNTGAAFTIGKGTIPADFVTGVVFTPSKCYGRNVVLPADWASTTLFDIGVCDYIKISGCEIGRFGAMFKTTADSANISIANTQTLGVPLFARDAEIDDLAAFSFFGFTPQDMNIDPFDAAFSTMPMAAKSLELIPQERFDAGVRKMFADSAFGNKITYTDAVGNYSDPISRLSVTGYSGWTFNEAKLVPGETVRNATVGLGEVALWQSMRHSVDTATSLAGASTTLGSFVLSRAASFFPIDIGDYVTVSAGMPSATAQYRVVNRAVDYTTITIATAATSTVVTAATVATEAHQLVPIAQQGYRSQGSTPVGSLTPFYIGEKMFRTDTGNWYISTGLTLADWKQTT